MRLITNSVDSSNVREENINGTRYFIAEDVPFLKSQTLAGGYVPSDHVEQSADKWDVPLTVNHPRNESGDIVSANHSSGQSATTGESTNPRPIDGGERVSADLRINADLAESIGPEGEALIDGLENGEGLDVSSQYFADDLPAGNYDGKFRHEVEGNLRPDSIALLPNKSGVCSLPDCGIAPGAGTATANSAARGQAGCDDQHLSVTAEPQPSANAGEGMAGSTDGESLIRRGLAMLGAVSPDAPTANCDGCDGGDACDCTEGSDEPAESGGGGGQEESEITDNSTMVEVDREVLTKSIAQQTELDSSTLSELGDEAIVTIYQSAVKGGSSDDDGSDDDGGDGGGSVDVEASGEPAANSVDLPDPVAGGDMSMDEYINAQISANQEQSEKEDLVDDIVANSAEYDADDRDDLTDAPTSLLRDVRDRHTDNGNAGLPGASRATANAEMPGAGGDDPDLDEFGSGVIKND